ncbi:hypothetical protein GALMADRAFT_144295 [Galerina marginata CBS 339.88]|uniref:Uncharacterized protein n=1 Tax=Galerina marginata (strain CBS 339.88) TaxID=685588 RepID=A0A067SIR6_GALM3|nr:hypothetical protein GALMADRAFT_144295 [Galerina marginata CBS 339.88]
MLCAPPGGSFQTFGRMVYDVPELLESIAEQTSWKSLVALGNSSKYAQELMRRIVRRRIKHLVLPFTFHARNVDMFFTLLRVTEAGITGSLAWSVMAAVEERSEPRPLNDLNIVVPKGGQRLWYWMRFLASLGYSRIMYSEALGIDSVVSRQTLSFETDGCLINVTESKTSSIIPVVISSPLTSMMNAVTYWRVYCFLPSLFARRVALETINTRATSVERIDLNRRGIALHTLSYINWWDEACGESCPAIWRQTRGLAGVGIARWGGMRAGPISDESDIPSPIQELGKANVKWRIGRSDRLNNYDGATVIVESLDI